MVTHSIYSERKHVLETLEHLVTSQTTIPFSLMPLKLMSHWKAAWGTCQWWKKEASCQPPTSWHYWTCPYSMACEVLPQGRCKPVFPDMWMLAGKQDLKWPPKQCHGQILQWRYYLDCKIKTHDCWVASIKFLCESSQERAQSAIVLHKKNVNDLHVELGHPSETITHATAIAVSFQVTSTFKPSEHCTLEKAKKSEVSKKAVAHSKMLGERLFFDISFPSPPTFGGKKHWLLVIEDSSNYTWSIFLKEKSDLAFVMLGFINILKINIIYRYNTCAVTMLVKILPSKNPANGKGGDGPQIHCPR